MADILSNDAPPPALPAAAHADPAAAAAQHDHAAECIDGQLVPPPSVSPPLAAAPASTTSQPPPSTTSDAARAVRFRPAATNEWDRMPAEIQNMILAHAGILTLWVNGRIDDADVSLEQFELMLRDICETDWQGNLTTLPFDKFKADLWFGVFRHSFTRSMHSRVKALGFSNLDNILDQVAIHNGWTSLLNFDHTKQVASNSIR
ncbi:hypothetical protein HK105_208897 [Polyrhizophydium stewartii]|uniref:Uncharacterized protein n=1 Tax=Polyrhizophydium stewartii TaxID=2732419 RepID=A0ABR4MWK0_9FUNG